MNIATAFQSITTGSARRQRSITQLLSLLVASILLPLLTFSALVLWQINEIKRGGAEKEAFHTANQLALNIDRDLRGLTATLTGLASSPALKTNNLQLFYEQASGVAKISGTPILLRDAVTGQQLINTRRPFGALLPSMHEPNVDAAILDTKKPYVSDLLFGPVAQTYVVSVAVPAFRDQGNPLVLIGAGEPRWFAAILADQQFSPDWMTLVCDRTGKIVAQSQELEKSIGQSSDLEIGRDQIAGVAQATLGDGTAVLHGYKMLASGWRVSAYMPLSKIEYPLRNAWLVFLASGGLLLAMALPLTLYFASRITRSIEEVAERAAALEHGAVVPLVSSDVTEINKVGAALNSTSIALRERTRSLAESAARFRLVFEQAAVGFEQIDLDGKWVMLNNRFCELLGYSMDECLALSPAEVTHPEDQLIRAPLLERVLRGDLPSFTMDKRFLRKGREPIWVRSTTSLVHDLDGRPLYFISVVEDITTQQKARAATARLAALVQASNDAIISIATDGTIETWNPGAARLFGHHYTAAVGKTLCLLAPPNRHEELRSLLTRALRGEAFRIETVLYHKDGTALDLAVGVSPILARDDTVAALSVTMEDIRERRQWERQLILLNRELQHRIKNSLAVAQSIANQTMRSSPSPRDFGPAFRGRLQALSAANDLLLQAAWTGSDLREIISLQLTPLLSNPATQLVVTGPSVTLPSNLTVPLGLAFHELGTNALKYGSLSVPNGRIEITWVTAQHEEGQCLLIAWSETGGPSPARSDRKGFGTTLIHRGIPGATVEQAFNSGGMVCTIRLLLAAASKLAPPTSRVS